jgi:ribose transport system substrate-binding protein
MHALSTFRQYASARSRCAMIALGLALFISGCNTAADGGKAAAGPKQKRLVILINTDSPYWDAAREGMKQGAKDVDLAGAGLTITMDTNDGTIQGQINKLRQYATQPDIVGIAVSPLEANNAAIASEMQELQDKGVHIITVDGDLARDRFRGARKYYIGTDNMAAGRVLGIAAQNLLPDGGGYVPFVGRTGAYNAIERMDGIKDGAGQKFKELDRMGDDTDKSKARDNVRNSLRNFPDLKMLVGIWSYNAPAITDVVAEMNKRDQVKVLTFDAEKLAIDQMTAGNIDAMVVQDPYNMGYQTCRLFKGILAGEDRTLEKMFPKAGQPDGDLLDTGLKIVVPVGSPLKAEMFGDKAEFYELDAFKKWLETHHLTSS